MGRPQAPSCGWSLPDHQAHSAPCPVVEAAEPPEGPSLADLLFSGLITQFSSIPSSLSTVHRPRELGAWRGGYERWGGVWTSETSVSGLKPQHGIFLTEPGSPHLEEG